jgi:hypothetical protein
MEGFIDLFKEAIEAFETATGIKIPEQITAIVILVVLLAFFVLKPIIKNRKWRKKQLDEILKDYGEYTTWQQRWLYIKTWFQSNPPHDLDDPSEAQYQDLRTDSIDFFINDALVPNNRKPPYYCILGGSGMGKSTFIVNLVRKYINKYREKTLPYPIKLLYCGERVQGKDVLIERIKEIKDKNNTILVLDALDESNKAIDDYSEFSKDLLENIVDFRFVIITCRTQFFEKNEDELEMVPKRQPGSKGQQRFKKYYVSPLKDKEIRRYLNKKYLLRFFAKKKAKAIVKNCNQVMARPLLLSYIDDLLNSNIEDRPESVIHIYEIIIDKWLEREACFAATGDTGKYKKTLLEFSYEIALYLAQPTQYALSHPNNENSINAIIKRYKDQYVIKEKNLKGRSLLNRNSKNEFKFAHKSFMEYLVAKQLFEQKGILLESIDCVSNDMTPKFLSYFIRAQMREQVPDQVLLILSDTFSLTWIRAIKSIDGHMYMRIPNGVPAWMRAYHYSFKRSIEVRCNVSENIAKYISAFISISQNIVINCNFDYSKINQVILDYVANEHEMRLINLIIINYDFRNYSLVEFLKPLRESYNVQLRIEFLVEDIQIFKTGDSQILQYLQAISTPLPKSNIDQWTSLEVLYWKNGEYVPYNNTKDRFSRSIYTHSQY